MPRLRIQSTSEPSRRNPIVGSRLVLGLGCVWLVAVRVSAQAGSEVEPNDTTMTATSVGSSSFTVQGAEIGNGEHAARDVDIYRLDLTGAARIDATVQAAQLGSTLDAVLWLRSCAGGANPDFPDDCVLGIMDDAPDGSLDPRVTVAVSSAMPIYLLVSSHENRRYDPTTTDLRVPGHMGTYNLVVTVTSNDPTGPYEPNDSILMATNRPYFIGSASALTGVIGDGPFATTRGDRDFYAVNVGPKNPGGMLLAEVKPKQGSDLEPLLIAYDYLGGQLARGYRDPKSNSVKIEVPIRCPGDAIGTFEYERDPATVFVMVMGAGQEAPIDPFLPAANIAWPTNDPSEPLSGDEPKGSVGPYELRLFVRPGLCSPEPDGALALSTDTGIEGQGIYLCSDGRLGNRYSPPCPGDNDVDMWRFEVTAVPSHLTASVSTCGTYSENVLRLFDEAGTEVGRAPNPQVNAGGLIGAWRGVTELQIPLNRKGTYYVGLSGSPGAYDPSILCSGDNFSGEETYEIAISLSNDSSGTGRARPGAQSPASTGQESRVMGSEALAAPVAHATRANEQLFATRLDNGVSMITLLDANSGKATASFAAPEAGLAGSEGLAYDGTHLYFLGSSRFPVLYRIDPVSGDVLDSAALWMGSGYYDDATILTGRLYLTDILDRSVHVMDPSDFRFLTTLRIGAINDIALGGGLAALMTPARLYLADAFQSGQIHEVDPLGGVVTGTLPASEIRPVSLGASGKTDQLYAADRGATALEVRNRSGGVVRTLALAAAVGSLAGTSFAGPFPDCNANQFDDLKDIAGGSSADCNHNGHPDECDVSDGLSLDCNKNAVPDDCEADCDADMIPDDCETDCSENGRPDDCEPDCNRNGNADDCDLVAGASLDANSNALPDECELTLFVDASAGADGDGRSWATALRDLQMALAWMQTRDVAYGEIRVAGGTYRPTGPHGDRDATFRLSSGIGIYGGYAGGGHTDPNRRDFAAFPTILSGDVNDDPSNGNSRHVVTTVGTNPTAILDGITVTGGMADGDASSGSDLWSSRCGGGILNVDGSPTIRDCRFSGNLIGYGQSVLGLRPSGGAVYSQFGNPRFVRCTFIDNGSLPALRLARGGAVCSISGRPTFEDCDFIGNAAGDGPAIYGEDTELALRHCRFGRNSGVYRGGALFEALGTVRVSHSIFSGNQGRHVSNARAGAVVLLGANLFAEHCTWSHNSEGEPGRAIGCTSFFDGSATSPVATSSFVDVVNSILWDGGSEILNELDASTIRIRYTTIAEGWAGLGQKNLDLDPQFLDAIGADGIVGTVDDDLRLRSTSPCIDAGDPTFVILPDVSDLDGHARVLCGRTDMGAFEFGIGDENCDRVVDLLDFSAWPQCFRGPDLSPHATGCEAFDFGLDADVDLEDLHGLQNLFVED